VRLCAWASNLGMRAPTETPAEKSLPNIRRETSLELIRGKVRQKTNRVPVEVHLFSTFTKNVVDAPFVTDALSEYRLV